MTLVQFRFVMWMFAHTQEARGSDWNPSSEGLYWKPLSSAAGLLSVLELPHPQPPRTVSVWLHQSVIPVRDAFFFFLFFPKIFLKGRSSVGFFFSFSFSFQPPTLVAGGRSLMGAHQSSRMTLTKLATSVSLASCTVKKGCCCSGEIRFFFLFVCGLQQIKKVKSKANSEKWDTHH